MSEWRRKEFTPLDCHVQEPGERLDSGLYSLPDNSLSSLTLEPGSQPAAQNLTGSQTKSKNTDNTNVACARVKMPQVDECYSSLSGFAGVSEEDNQLKELMSECEEGLKPAPGLSPLVESFCLQDDELNTVLHWTIVYGWEDLSLKIIHKSTNPFMLDVRNNLLQTPLFLALYTRQMNVSTALIKAGVDLTRRYRGETYFHIVARTGDFRSLREMANRVTSQHSDVINSQNAAGLYPVHVAVLSGHIHILELLRKMGADINMPDGKAGFTPLHHAIREYGDANERLIRYLVEQAKVDLCMGDFYNRRPIMLAEGYRCTETVVYLVNKGYSDDLEWLNCPPCSDSSGCETWSEDDEAVREERTERS